jgi:dihydrofolate reductase
VSASISIDGFGAGPQQSRENPQGVGGLALAEWAFATRTFQRMHGKDWTVEGIHRKDKGTAGIDDDFFARSFQNVGAFILGRNMFGPVRGPWRDNSWKGWWGDTPPWRAPVFVLTHYPRDSIPMQGGTTFHFVTDGIHRALERATAAANGKDVRIGGIATVQQYLRASSMSCIWRYPQCSSARANASLATLISSSSDTPVRSTSRASVRRMSF